MPKQTKQTKTNKTSQKYQHRFEEEYVSQSLTKHGLSFIDNFQQKLQSLIQNEPFLHFVDKFSFVCGVLLLILTVHMLSSHQTLFHYYYLLIILPLLVARYFIYKKNKWQYFMIDFCYFVQCLTIVLICIIFFSKDENGKVDKEIVSPLLQVVFVFSHGPLLMAIPMWRNSLVFHDLDRMTSCCIHIFPALVAYCIRWGGMLSFNENNDDINNNNFDNNNNNNYNGNEIQQLNTNDIFPSISLWNGFILPSILYIIWQIGYLIITEGFKKETIQKNHYITSLVWLSQEQPHPIYLYLLKKGVKDRPLIILISFQFVYTMLTIIPTFLYYHFKFLNILWILFCTIWAIRNGASFYFEVFIKRYSKRVEKSVRQLQKKEGKNQIEVENNEDDDDSMSGYSDTSDIE